MIIKKMFYKKAFLSLTISVLLTSCSSHKEWDYHDPNLQTKKQDYDLLTKKPVLPKSLSPLFKKKKELPSTLIPTAFQKPISLTVTKSIPLKDLFLTIAQQTNGPLILEGTLEGSATLHVINQPAIEILQELCQTHGLRYRLSKGILKIEKDMPYLKNYNLQFLILARSNQNRLSIATDVFTGVDSTTSEEDNGSNTTLSAETKTDFWQELEDNLSVILTEFSNLEDPSTSTPAKYTIHKQAGIISVFANDEKHRQIQEYLTSLQENIERQVLIEAKIVEVTLNDEFRSGINWNVLKGDFVLQMPLGDITTPGPLDENAIPQRNIFTLGGQGKNARGLINLLNHFGTVRTLSNPRLTVINNQTAVLKVARNKVYFKLNYTRDYNYFEKREQTFYSSSIKTVPIGLMLYVHPTIRPDGRIIMTLRPTISQIIQEVADPAVGIASSQKVQSLVPEVQVRELDTLLSMNSGETIMVGGFMQEVSSNEQDGIPEAQDVPVVGGLFKGKSNDRKITELVIFLRAIIIENEKAVPLYEPTGVTPADQTTYQTFTKDPRPLNF